MLSIRIEALQGKDHFSPHVCTAHSQRSKDQLGPAVLQAINRTYYKATAVGNMVTFIEEEG